MRIFDRREPLRSLAIVIGGLALAVELLLLLGGRWVLVGQRETEGNDAYFGQHVSSPPTRTWRVLTCSYWTGRSFQTVELSGEFGDPPPRECPFVTPAV